jgi:SAM-dependent MidA family methyltransferase
MIGVNGGELMFVLSPAPVPLEVPPERGEPKTGDIYEVCPSGEAIAEQLSSVVSEKGGAALLVDYGYAGAGFGETLQAVSQHKFAGVLENPGEADLSAHVDFAALARMAERSGAKAYVPIEQGALLQSLGIAQRAENLIQRNPAQRNGIASAVERLVSAQQMGSLFKAMAIVPKNALEPPGFG